jgi:hypothetical protein
VGHGMKGNRKKSETYRFNGNPFLDTHSIHSVEIADLERYVKELETKLADPNDTDAKNWTARWLSRFQRELAKKRKGVALKKNERSKSSRTLRRLDLS